MATVSNFTSTATGQLTTDQNYQLNIWAGIALPVILFGAFGNILTLMVIIRAKWYATGIQVLILTLTICGVCTTAFVYPLAIVGAMVRNPTLWLVPGICSATGFVIYSIACMIPLTCAMIAINRLCIIVFPHQTRGLTRQKGGVTMSAVALLISSLTFVAPLLGLDGRFGVIEPLQICLWQQWTASQYFQSAFFLVIYVIPGLVIAVCYVVIFLYLHVMHFMAGSGCSTSKVHLCGGRVLDRPGGGTNFEIGRRLTRLIQATKMMGVTFLVYVLCFLPLNIMMAWMNVELYAASYSTLYAWLILLYCASDCLHPVIYAVMNRDFSNAYLDLLRHCRIFRRSPTMGLKRMLENEGKQALAARNQTLLLPTNRSLLGLNVGGSCGCRNQLIPRDSIPRENCTQFLHQLDNHGGVYLSPQDKPV